MNRFWKVFLGFLLLTAIFHPKPHCYSDWWPMHLPTKIDLPYFLKYCHILHPGWLLTRNSYGEKVDLEQAAVVSVELPLHERYINTEFVYDAIITLIISFASSWTFITFEKYKRRSRWKWVGSLGVWLGLSLFFMYFYFFINSSFIKHPFIKILKEHFFIRRRGPIPT